MPLILQALFKVEFKDLLRSLCLGVKMIIVMNVEHLIILK